MNYFIVQYNPDKYDQIGYLRKYKRLPDWWNVRFRKYFEEIEIGNIIFVWKAKGSENQRGIYAKAKVIAVPGKEQTNQRWLEFIKNPVEKEKWLEQPYVDVIYLKLILDTPLLDNELKERGFGDLPLVDTKRGMYRNGIYKIDEKAGQNIEAIVDKR